MYKSSFHCSLDKTHLKKNKIWGADFEHKKQAQINNYHKPN